MSIVEYPVHSILLSGRVRRPGNEVLALEKVVD